jgi:hypothetical protein
VITENSNNPNLRNYYKKYCEVLSNVINESKRFKYDSKIKKSSNKNTTIWDTAKLETGKTRKNENICAQNIDGELTSNHHKIADAFKKYFLSVAESINTKNNPNDSSNNNIKNTTPIHYLLQSVKKFTLKSLSTREVDNIIKSIEEFPWI